MTTSKLILAEVGGCQTRERARQQGLKIQSDCAVTDESKAEAMAASKRRRNRRMGEESENKQRARGGGTERWGGRINETKNFGELLRDGAAVFSQISGGETHHANQHEADRMCILLETSL